MFGAYVVRGGGQYVPFVQKEGDRAKVQLRHMEEFGLHVINNHDQRCRVTVICDRNTKQPAGTWIMDAKNQATLYRKSSEDKAFVCVKENSTESMASGGNAQNPENGFIDIIFTPELSAPPPPPPRVVRSMTFEDDEEPDLGGWTSRRKKCSMHSKDRDLSDESHVKKESKAHVGYGRETGQTFGRTNDITRIDKDRIRTVHLQIVCCDDGAPLSTTITTTNNIIAANPIYVHAV